MTRSASAVRAMDVIVAFRSIVGEGVWLGVCEGVKVAVGVNEGVWLGVRVGVNVNVGVDDGVWVGVKVFVGV
ncbi:MAG: hypothetical protein C3F07_06715 [Anaerolineales bacterium]|nr:MAG: hypothetical protein C3F07_06715 [Anaerolineales bacterium]